MLRLKNISKDYNAGEQCIHALKNISIDFRDSEFVSVLGQSGCGKTTLMNIIGGLDRATEGEIIIDSKSTRNFSEVEWDTYRNAKIGFIFQNYNLIPHLTVLDNVELALTISGVDGKDRTERAKKALDDVGLANQYSKLPNQLSGGQMQRVAIARAIVNRPEILLADEPTGAIDSETSVQIMELLKELSRDRLVIMVTHNAELAEKYSTRIIKLLDGQLVADSNPTQNISIENDAHDTKTAKATHSSMPFFTAVKISLKNLINKRGRSLLTILAGSISVICLALILALNNGFGIYIANFEERSMSKYPITVSSGENSIFSEFEEFIKGDELSGDSINISSIFDILSGNSDDNKKFTDEQLVYIYRQFSAMFKEMMGSSSKEIDISIFKHALDDSFDPKIGTYKLDYSISLNVYKQSKNIYSQINPLSKSSVLAPLLSQITGGETGTDRQTAMMSVIDSYAFWDELIADNLMIRNQYDVIAGDLPKNMSEIVLVVDRKNRINDFDAMLLNEIGLSDLLAATGDESYFDDKTKTFDEILSKTFSVLPTSAAYIFNEETALFDDVNAMNKLEQAAHISQNGIPVKISGILRAKEGVDGCIKGVIGYTSELGDYIINDANNCDYIKAQKQAYQDYLDVIAKYLVVYEKIQNGTSYYFLTDEEKAAYNAFYTNYIPDVRTGEEIDLKQYSAILSDMNVRDFDKPSYIYLYPNKIGHKDKIVEFINEFNKKCKTDEEEAARIAIENGEDVSKITGVVGYSDNLDSVVNELNGVVDTITYIMIAVALVAVIVTMLLIAIIMYISVQDRTREIGIMRALGARKLDISNVFNVETMLLGIFAGIIGVILSLILQFPVNLIFANTLGISGLLHIAWWHPIVLIVGALLIIVLSGLIPSVMAAKKDPVVALRSE